MFNSNFPEGFSISISADGAATSTSREGASISADGRDASTSTLGFFPLMPNLGSLM